MASVHKFSAQDIFWRRGEGSNSHGPQQRAAPFEASVLSIVWLLRGVTKLGLSHLEEFSHIISFGCIAKAAFPAKDRLEEWLIEDPSGQNIEIFE